jgi:hypothetical protein
MPLRAIAAALSVLLLVLLSATAVHADTISLLLRGEAKATAAVRVVWEGGASPLTGAFITAEKGETAKQFTDRAAKELNENSLVKDDYTFEAKHTALGDELRIIPKKGIPNFTKAQDGRIATDVDPGFNYSPRLERKKASRSTFELEDLATALLGDIEWNAYVLIEDQFVATSTHIVSNLIKASDLLSMFAADFEAQGVHVELASRMLTLNSKTGMHFFVERSDSTNLYPLLAMEAPEPAAMTLLGVCLAGVTARQVRTRRRRS